MSTVIGICIQYISYTLSVQSLNIFDLFQANLCPNPLEVYQALESKGICIMLADFYTNWSWEMEKTGNIKRADGIYQKGLQLGAKPYDVLQEAHK